MSPRLSLAALAALCALLSTATALENGLALTPPMGYNTWNSFGINIDEETVRSTADLMVTLGLKDAGYEYLNLDDAWSEPQRIDGRLVGNRATFPSGIKHLADYVHAKGLKFGIYSDAGSHTCAGFPGSRGYEEVDAQTWADWGVDYLKYDNCFAPASDWVINRYTAMGAALNATGRPILYSLCEWGVADPWLWAPQVGNSWRTSEDITPSPLSIFHILDINTGLARFAKPGAWNDPDMLEVGNGQLTLGEQRAHFGLWALQKAPLLIGADLRNISADSLAILKAREVIAINQDPLGVAGDMVWQQGSYRIYAGPLAGGGRAVVMLNLHNIWGQYPLSNMTVHWRQLGLLAGTAATVRDLYAEKDLGVFTDSFTAEVWNHDVRVLRITPVDALPQGDSWRPWHEQPVYDEDSKQGVPRREDLVPGDSGSSGDTRSGGGPGSARKVAPGGQHAMYALQA